MESPRVQPRHRTAHPAFTRYARATFPPDLAARALALAHQLPDPQVDALGALLEAVGEWGIARAVEVHAAWWERLLAHLPGLAPVLCRVQAHVERPAPDCPRCRATGP